MYIQIGGALSLASHKESYYKKEVKITLYENLEWL